MAFKDKAKAIEALKTRSIKSPMFDNFRNNIDFARAALERNGENMYYLGDTIKKNYGFASMICEKNPLYISLLDDEIRNDPLFIKKVIFRVVDNEEIILLENGKVFDLRFEKFLNSGLQELKETYRNNKAKHQDEFARMLYVCFSDELRRKMIDQGGDDFFKMLLNDHYGTIKQSINKMCEKIELKNTLTLELKKEEVPVKKKIAKI